MTIRLDKTQISVVVKCSLCPWWSGFADNTAQGWNVGARHEQRAHPASEQARDAQRKNATRR